MEGRRRGNGTPRSWNILPSRRSWSLPRSWPILGSPPSWFKCMGRANSIRPYRGWGSRSKNPPPFPAGPIPPTFGNLATQTMLHSSHPPKRPTSNLRYAAGIPAPSTEAFPNMPRMSPEPDPYKNTSFYSPKQNHFRTLSSHFVHKKERAILKNIKMTL